MLINGRPPTEPLLTPAEVASLFRVDPKTVTRWAGAGKIHSVRTPGGHRRYKRAEIMELLDGLTEARDEPPAVVRLSEGEAAWVTTVNGVEFGVLVDRVVDGRVSGRHLDAAGRVTTTETEFALANIATMRPASVRT